MVLELGDGMGGSVEMMMSGELWLDLEVLVVIRRIWLIHSVFRLILVDSPLMSSVCRTDLSDSTLLKFCLHGYIGSLID